MGGLKAMRTPARNFSPAIATDRKMLTFLDGKESPRQTTKVVAPASPCPFPPEATSPCTWNLILLPPPEQNTYVLLILI